MRKLKNLESYSYEYNPMVDYDAEEYDLNGRLLWRINSLQTNGTIFYFYNFYTYDEIGREDKIYCEMKRVSDEHWRPFTLTKFRHPNNSTNIITYNSVPNYKIPDSPYTFFFPPLPPQNRNNRYLDFPAFNVLCGSILKKDDEGKLLHSYEKYIEDDAVYKVGVISRGCDISEMKYKYNSYGTLISEIHLEDGRISLRKNHQYGEFYEENLYSIFTYEEYDNYGDPYDEPDEEELEQYDEDGDYDPDDEFEYDGQYGIYEEEHGNLKFLSREIYEDNLVVKKVLSGKKIYNYIYNSANQLVKIISTQRTRNLFEVNISYPKVEDENYQSQEILVKSFGGYPPNLNAIIDIPDYHYNLELWEYFSELKIDKLKIIIKKSLSEIVEIKLIDPRNNKLLEHRFYNIDYMFTDNKPQPRSINAFIIKDDEIKPLFTKNFEYYN